jgi:peroxiredoxin (alkyl hydroperoxide reductase subunit C)
MSILVGKTAPDFSAPAVLADGQIVDSFSLSDTITGKYAIVFFYPLDFTFVCPSEIIAMSHRMDKLCEMGVEVIGVSIDSHFTHNAWRNTPVEEGGIGPIEYTLVGDIDHAIARAYGIEAEADDSYYPAGVAMRASFIIDQKSIVRSQIVNDEPIGRNMDELVRVVDALLFFEKHGQVCPAGWQKGDKGMLNTPEGVASYLSESGQSL